MTDVTDYLAFVPHPLHLPHATLTISPLTATELNRSMGAKVFRPGTLFVSIDQAVVAPLTGEAEPEYGPLPALGEHTEAVRREFLEFRRISLGLRDQATGATLPGAAGPLCSGAHRQPTPPRPEQS